MDRTLNEECRVTVPTLMQRRSSIPLIFPDEEKVDERWFSFSKQARDEAAVRCTDAEGKNLSTPEIDQFSEKENHLLLR